MKQNVARKNHLGVGKMNHQIARCVSGSHFDQPHLAAPNIELQFPGKGRIGWGRTDVREIEGPQHRVDIVRGGAPISAIRNGRVAQASKDFRNTTQQPHPAGSVLLHHADRGLGGDDIGRAHELIAEPVVAIGMRVD